MFDPLFIKDLVTIWIGLAGCTFVLLLFVSAPYGRHSREGWGPTIPERLAWVVMETPAALVMPALLLASSRSTDPWSWVFVILWEVHYVHRSWIYPFRRASTQKRMPLVVVVMGILFNLTNGYVNAAYLFFVLPAHDHPALLGQELDHRILHGSGYGASLGPIG